MNYRNTRCYLNCEKRIYDGDGDYEVPCLNPVDFDVEGVPLIGFNYAMTEKHPEDKICHFYLDDYQFERVWRNPDAYLNVLSRFKAVLSPDFSMYSDFPRAVSIFNHYRKQWCGAYWQENGINVIPTVGWTRPDSYEYCFDGMPKHSLVCISTVGMFFNKEHREKFMDGYYKALDVLQPSKILFYGKVYPEITVPEGIEYCAAVNQNTIDRELNRKTDRKGRKIIKGDENNVTEEGRP